MDQTRVQELLGRLELADVRAFQLAHNQINPSRPLLVSGSVDRRTADALEEFAKAPKAFKAARATTQAKRRGSR